MNIHFQDEPQARQAISIAFQWPAEDDDPNRIEGNGGVELFAWIRLSMPADDGLMGAAQVRLQTWRGTIMQPTELLVFDRNGDFSIKDQSSRRAVSWHLGSRLVRLVNAIDPGANLCAPNNPAVADLKQLLADYTCCAP
jgi:hypothetical protein